MNRCSFITCPRAPRRCARRPAWLAVLLLSAGCAIPIGVDRVGSDAVHDQLNSNILTSPELSTTTREALFEWSLTERFIEDPEVTLERLRSIAVREGRRDLLFALAELHYSVARATGSHEHELATALCAYWYLFDNLDPMPPSPYDRRFRAACDLYNRALARALSDDDRRDLSLANRTCALPGGEIALEFDPQTFAFPVELFERFVPTDDLVPRGLDIRYRDHGLGVPVACERPFRRTIDLQLDYMAPNMKVPATVFLHVRDGPATWGAAPLHASLELYSGFDPPVAQVAGHTVPLESDLTTTLAYTLEKSIIWDFELAGFFGGNEETEQSGMFMVYPYQKGRIPVVLVHGTASSPARWAPIINALFTDPEIRSRCQFWVFLYTTGVPVVYSASVLRTSIHDVIAHVDPEGTDPALEQMVVIGHSQGGLLTRLMATSTGDTLYDHLSKTPLDEIQIPETTRAIIRKSLYFDAVPQVRRLVFLSTPHAGSELAGNWFGRMISSFVDMPRRFLRAMGDLGKLDPSNLPPELRRGIPTSLDNMHSKSKFIRALQVMPMSERVRRHSIIAVREGEPIEDGSDGLVDYKSAHIEDVDSEYIVRSGHSCQAHPGTLVEIRRILREHIRAWDEERAKAVEK